jgi:hypothetical protein
VYVWLWKRLPGPWPVKVLQCAVLLTIVVLLLFTVVFPWVEPRLPFTDVTVNTMGTPSASGALDPVAGWAA